MHSHATDHHEMDTDRHGDFEMIPKKVYQVRSCSFQRNKIMFLQTCAAMMLVCIVCYTCIQSEERTPQVTLLPAQQVSQLPAQQVSQLPAQQVSQLPTQQVSQLSARPNELILLWTTYFKQRDWLPSTTDLQCPVRCEITSNRSLFANSSAVILHWRNLDPKDLPDTCALGNHSCPALVLFNQEAPPHTPWISELDGRIHWSATYRRDSELYAPYGEIVTRTDAYKKPGLDPKRALVCWLVSHCTTPSSREVYVNSLKRHVDVQVYGKCGDRICPRTKALDCYRWLSRRCKFYLSFENARCRDYATEKLFYALMTDMVPVVLGGEGYAAHLPPHSFIDVADYSSPEALAAYLKELGRDEARYSSYFEWKKEREARIVDFRWLCELCERLHNRTGGSELEPLKGFKEWWFEGANCTTWPQKSSQRRKDH